MQRFHIRRLRVAAVLAIGLVGAIGIAPVAAISNGVPDGNGHPNVGALLADFSGDGKVTGDEAFCSGSLISPTVFLTAGHCVEFLEPAGIETIYVSFDSALLDADGPGTLIATTEWAFDPGFYTSFRAAHDIGVVLLPAGSTDGITPVVLPTAGVLDAMQRAGDLRSTLIRNVGYGVIPGWKRGPATFGYDGNRNTSVSPVMSLTKTWLKLQMNNDATGLGGVCFGDSGSPKFIEGTNSIVAITTGGDGNCRSLNYNYRLDTPEARAFLGAYVTLP
jgi:V8-like Glu-specific endopeptidase